jgi:hypothetical protein
LGAIGLLGAVPLGDLIGIKGLASWPGFLIKPGLAVHKNEMLLFERFSLESHWQMLR